MSSLNIEIKNFISKIKNLLSLKYKIFKIYIL
nr:MAG TPA: hypothetical protein [Caudoviricetes sp.]